MLPLSASEEAEKMKLVHFWWKLKKWYTHFEKQFGGLL